jgi:hypothetical protein
VKISVRLLVNLKKQITINMTIAPSGHIIAAEYNGHVEELRCKKIQEAISIVLSRAQEKVAFYRILS